jgi:peroxiredoxin
MNRAKSFFITVASTTWAYFSYLAILLAVNSGLNLATIGVIMISLVPVEFLARLLILKPWARTSRFLPVYTGSVLIGTAIVFYSITTGNLPGYYFIVSGTSLSFWLLYIFWYSQFPSRNHENLAPGNQLPELKFKGSGGEEVSTTDFNGKKVIYLFYRGNWCPLCMAQIKEIAGEYRALNKRGVEVALVSPQPQKNSEGLARKMAVDFHFLTDEKNKMARLLGLDVKYGVPLGMEIFGYNSETVLPTVIITDETGKIIFLDQTDNYRVRPEPATFIHAIDAV